MKMGTPITGELSLLPKIWFQVNYFHNPSTASEMVTFADRALYYAKVEGRNRVRIYNEERITRNEV